MLYGAEHCLSEEDPHAAIQKLVAPIPDDEALRVRTAKANAQHVQAGIGTILTTDKIRQLQARGNHGTLQLIGRAAGITVGPKTLYYFDEEGNWSDPEMQADAQRVIDELTPEKTEFLKNALHLLRSTLESPEVKQMIKERKEALSNWEHKNEAEKARGNAIAAAKTREIAQALEDTLFETYDPSEHSREEMLLTHKLRLAINDMVNIY